VGGKTFPRAARLLTRAAFDEVFRAGQSAGSNFFRALVRPASTPEARLGITVPKRVLKFAHDRNRVKRLVREAFRAQRAVLPAIDIVLLARGAIAGADNPALRADLIKILSRASALKLQPDAGKMPDSIDGSP
jgi:ribonuclease P protein component